VDFTPHQDEEGGFYEFAGQASWGKLLTGVVGQLRWCPRRDSRAETFRFHGRRFRLDAPMLPLPA